MQQLLLAFVLSITPHHPSQELPSEPFQNYATRYLSGRFGEVDPRLAKVYRLGLSRGLTANRTVWFTCYYPHEGKQGKIDAHSRKCTSLTAAANEIPQFSWIWSSEIGLRQITDKGARSNDTLARNPPRRKGRPVRPPAEFWTDVWYKSKTDCKWGHSKVMKAVVIR